MEEIGIVIPAYNPDEKLVKLVNNLIEIGIQRIIVVNSIKKQIKIEQVPIHAIYLKKQSSHFKKGKDSIKIIETILRSKKSSRL